MSPHEVPAKLPLICPRDGSARLNSPCQRPLGQSAIQCHRPATDTSVDRSEAPRSIGRRDFVGAGGSALSRPDIDLSVLPTLPPVLPGCTCAIEGVENIPMIKTHQTKRRTGSSYRDLFPDSRFGSERAHARHSFSVGGERQPGNISDTRPLKNVHAAVAGQNSMAAIGCVCRAVRLDHHIDIVGPLPGSDNPSAALAVFGPFGRGRIRRLRSRPPRSGGACSSSPLEIDLSCLPMLPPVDPACANAS
jgi:hypothetical protein